MLSISPPVRGAGKADYYLNLAREDYYLKGGEPPGEWQGGGAEKLGLTQKAVGKEELSNLAQGFSPDGSMPLVQNAGEADRQSFWDVTFSAPKSVSVAWSQSKEELRREFQEAHREAVKVALRYLEAEAAFTRRGKGGLVSEPVELIIATFEHGTSRAQDPQLHTHCLVLNTAVREDGTTGTIQSRIIYQMQSVIGALYQVELAYQLEKRLHLLAEKKNRWFELKGVPEKLIKEFSKRREQIEKLMEEKGLQGLKGADRAVLESREAKEHVPRNELFEAWEKVGRKHKWSTPELEKLCAKEPPRRNHNEELRLAVSDALERLTFHQSHFTEREFVRFLAEEGQGRGLSAQRVITGATQALRNRDLIVSLGRINGIDKYTTPEVLKLEGEMLNLVTAGVQKESWRVRTSSIEQVLEGQQALSLEQRAALRHITETPGNVKLVSGMAGSGKSFLLKAAREAFEHSGYTVIGAALAGKAAQGLFESTGIESDTLHRLLNSIEAGKQTLTKKTILVVDEAAMVGTRQLAGLLRLVDKAGAKVILVGDAKQLQPIEAGGAFKAIASRIGQAELVEIKRQKEAWARDTVHDFSEGRAGEALKEYAKRGLLEIERDRNEAVRALVRSWAEVGRYAPKEHLILTSENETARELNQLCQLERKERALLGERSIDLGGERFYPQDRVLFTKNSRTRGVRNGQLGTVLKADRLMRRLTIKLDEGRLVSVDLKDYPHLRLGYAVTTHKAQGMTAENAYVLLGGSMQDREISYVQASRARSQTRFFTDETGAGKDLTDLVRSMNKSRQKELAVELRASAVLQEQTL